MAKIGLAPYSMRIWSDQDGQRVDYLPNELPGGQQLGQIFDGFLAALEGNYSELENQQKLLGVRNWNRNGRTAAGTFESGAWGFGSRLVDVAGQRDPYDRVPTQAEILPFYFTHHYAQDRRQSILILQKFKQYGVLGAFGRSLQDYLANIDSDLKVDLNPLVPSEYIQSLIEDGRLRSVQFIKHEIPDDVTEELLQGTSSVEGRMGLVLTAKRAASLPFLDWIERRMRLDDAEQIEILGMPFDDIKFTMSIGGSERTIDLGRLQAIRPTYDVSDDVDVGADGHPSWDSIHEEGQRTLERLRRGVWRNEG